MIFHFEMRIIVKDQAELEPKKRVLDKHKQLK